MNAKNTRIKEIDVLYSIGAVLAVLGHSHPNNWSSFEGSFFYHCIVFIYTFHMALFFTVAGILLVRSKSIETKPFIIFIKDKALKLLTPYVTLSILAIVPKGYLEYGNFDFLNLNFVIRTLFNPRDNIWGHFWFLPVLFICYILFGFLRKILSKASTVSTFCILSVCALIFLILRLYLPFDTGWLGSNDIFNFAFYMLAGMLLAYIRYDKSTPPILSAALSIFLFAVSIVIYIFFYSNAIARFVISLTMIFCLMILASLVCNKYEKFFGFLSQNIFTVYIYSWPFQSFVLIISEKLNFPLSISAPIMFVVGLICPLILKTVYTHFKKLNCRFFDLVLGIR